MQLLVCRIRFSVILKIKNAALEASEAGVQTLRAARAIWRTPEGFGGRAILHLERKSLPVAALNKTIARPSRDALAILLLPHADHIVREDRLQASQFVFRRRRFPRLAR
jgi:hypothetical protein